MFLGLRLFLYVCTCLAGWIIDVQCYTYKLTRVQGYYVALYNVISTCIMEISPGRENFCQFCHLFSFLLSYFTDCVEGMMTFAALPNLVHQNLLQ